MVFKTSGSLTTATKQVDGEATSLSVSATLPSNTSASVTVKQDESGAQSTDNSESVTLTDGTTTSDLTSFTKTSGSTYWLTFSLSTSDDSTTPSVDSATLTVIALSPPSNVQITDAQTEDELTLDWDTAGTNANGYYVYRAEVSFNVASDATQVADVTNPPYTDTGLEDGERYYYRVSSHD
jgi:hypothetical protein